MSSRWLVSWAALVALVGMSGCCWFCEKCCGHPVTCAQPVPVCCQPVCCQPVAAAPVPATAAPVLAQPQPTWQNPTVRPGYYYDPCDCAP
jgi:hypothetical protein